MVGLLPKTIVLLTTVIIVFGTTNTDVVIDSLDIQSV